MDDRIRETVSLGAVLGGLAGDLEALAAAHPSTPAGEPPPTVERVRLAHLRLRDEGRIRAEPDPARPRCPDCCGGWVSEERLGATYSAPCPRGCEAIMRAARRVDRAHVPWEHRDAEVETWHAGPRRPPPAAVAAYVDRWAPGTRGRALHGPPGTGKSRLGATVALAVALRGFGVRWAAWSQVLADMRSAMRDDESTAETESALMLVSLLVVDDIGAEKPTEWTVDVADRVIGARLAAGRTTIVTSNLSPDELTTKGSISDRLASRLAGACDTVQLVGADKRRER